MSNTISAADFAMDALAGVGATERSTSNTIPVDDWLRRIDGEYLSTFIRDGGASIKFAVTSDDSIRKLHDAVERLCRARDCVFVALDAAKLRAHMPQDLFFGLARQVEWRRLARRLILRLAAERGYRIDGIDPRDDGNVFEAVGALNNGLESIFVLNEIRTPVQEKVSRNRKMVRDFRAAMTHLCLNENVRGEGGYAARPVLDWLTGENTRVGNVRPFGIYTGINRTTARYMIESGLHWIRQAGCSGTVVLLDNRRVTVARNPKDGLRYYTRAMAMDHYELLREFIDGVDRLAGTLMIVATGEGFLDDGPGSGSRGFGIYEALKTRVMDDVRDRNLVNPVASLVRLS